MRTLHIFVSGTIDDMHPERQAVARAIKSLRLDAVRAETEYSADRSSRQKCLDMASWCDIYLGVHNQTRYGWTIPGDGISVTELEFNEAQRLKKPSLIFVKKLLAAEKQDPPQKTFLERVLDFDGGKFRASEFETIAQLEDAVAGALMNLLVERFQLTVTRPPFQVPRDLDVFVGREAQIAELTTALTHGTKALVHGLYGVGGLGKSALAVHVAHRQRDTFTDGVLSVDLPTVRPAETLAAWAREYGGDVSRIDDLNARADALRTLFSGRRILALLDGAMDERDDANLTPLLRALADCAVVVTSRVTQLDSLRDAKPVYLDRMSEEDALILFFIFIVS